MNTARLEVGQDYRTNREENFMSLSEKIPKCSLPSGVRSKVSYYMWSLECWLSIPRYMVSASSSQFFFLFFRHSKSEIVSCYCYYRRTQIVFKTANTSQRRVILAGLTQWKLSPTHIIFRSTFVRHGSSPLGAQHIPCKG